MSVASLNNGSLQLSELVISNEKYSNATGYLASSSTFSASLSETSLATTSITLPNDCVLTSNASGGLLVNGEPVGGGGGGAVNSVIAGDGIIVSGTTDVTVSINTEEYSTTERLEYWNKWGIENGYKK
jgi:hypothetical protein